MNKQLHSLFVGRLVTGLKRSSISSCSQWAMMYRVMGEPFAGPFSFKHHPWSKDMHDDESETIVGMKAAQMGFTEVALNKTFYTIDIKGSSVLYTLPAANPDATDFSASRFDPALDLSEHLRNMFSDVKNVGHKRAGSASLFIRGSRSRSQMKSVPASFIVFDELDEMNRDNVILARERSSGQNVGQEFMLSTPHIKGYGIDVFWEESSKAQYYFKCPHCSKMEYLRYPESLVIVGENPHSEEVMKSHLICTHCKKKLDNETKSDWLAYTNCEWVPENTDSNISGFAISQMYSMAKKASPGHIARMALLSTSDPVVEQELYNSKLGLCHTVKDAKVNDEDIKNSIGDFNIQTGCPAGNCVTMGVDVGPKFLHVEISEYLIKEKNYYKDINSVTLARVLAMMKVEHFEELDPLFNQFGIEYCVIDAMPERRKSLEFCTRNFGRASMCFYVQGKVGRVISQNIDEMTVSVGRTVWMDTALVRFKNKSIVIPVNTPMEYKDQVKEPTRIYERDSDGNPTGRYVNAKADHFAHARVYSEIALAITTGAAKNQDMTEKV